MALLAEEASEVAQRDAVGKLFGSENGMVRDDPDVTEFVRSDGTQFVIVEGGEERPGRGRPGTRTGPWGHRCRARIYFA